MELLQSAFEPYRHFDPAGWIGLFKVAPPWVGVLSIACGVVMLLWGGRQLFRIVAAPLGMLIAGIWAAPLSQRLGFAGSTHPEQLTMVSALVLFVAGVAWPPLVVFFAFGVPAGLLGGQLAGTNDWLLGFGPGFFVGGALGVVLHRIVGALVSAAAGAWLVVLGVLAACRPVLAVDGLVDQPGLVLSVAGVVAAAGAIFQIFLRPSEQKAEERRIEKALARKKARDQKVLMDRWDTKK